MQESLIYELVFHVTKGFVEMCTLLNCYKTDGQKQKYLIFDITPN